MTSVCVLGIRGGTSTVTGLLKQLGVDLGPDDLLLEPQECNPKGFFEFTPFHSINIEILGRYGGDWDRPPLFPPDWVSQCEDLEKQVREDIHKTFGQSSVWAFKDPRCCLTFPFWSHAIGSSMKCIVVVRNPLDTARSLGSMAGIEIERASDLWFEYMSKAFLSSRGHSRLVVFYEELFSDLEREVSGCADFVGKPVRIEAAKNFISKDLHHYRSSLEQVMQDVRISDRAKQSYRMLMKVKTLCDRGAWPDMMESCFR